MQSQPSQLLSISPDKLAVAGLIGLVPGVVMELVGVSFFVAPGNPVANFFARLTAMPESLRLFNIVTPLIMLGGAGLAFVLNVLPFIRLTWRRQNGEWVGEVRIKGRVPNIGIAVLSVVVVTIMVLYALGENWQCITGQKISC